MSHNCYYLGCSPKRSRRDGKPATEKKSSTNHNLDPVDRADQDIKHHRRLQDALPLEAPLEHDLKVGADATNTEVNRKPDGLKDATKGSSDPTKASRSRSFYQHDERDSARQDGRSFGHRSTAEHGRENERNGQSGDRKTDMQDRQKRDERTKDRNVWNHDGFSELEANVPPLPPTRKRPAFRENKMEPEAADTARVTAIGSEKSTHVEKPVSGNTRRDERGGRYPHDLDRTDRPYRRDRAPPPRGDAQRAGFTDRERFGGNGSGLRDRFSGRPGERNRYLPNSPSSFRVEKWKHDMYDEANRSPTKNEEDEIAKVEALLAL
ncbi:hypothetical protein GIB67_010785 [Kingdonia uniflora]|uniref:Btz domain-containing protein n=1 Tax=Kingdonia uniflora TaxID=39325 RepID=A0A7J7L912_9MAGN|nr:hypothetical protein GIB67_010785 [Kingdonia uniflora]